MKDAINNNFKELDTKIADVDKQLDVRIISNEIKEIKYENGSTSFTLDGETWIPLTSKWGAIKGEIQDQTDLIQFLSDNYANFKDFEDLRGKVTSLGTRLTTAESDINNLKTDVATLKQVVTDSERGLVIRVENLEDLTKDVVHSPNVKAIQFSTSTGEMQYSEDGSVWKSMKTLTEWGDIQGNIQNQSDLWLLISNLQKSVRDLDNAINLSGFVNLTEYDYEQVAVKQSNHIYNLTDIDF